MFRHFREAVALRREHPMFRLGEASLVRRAVKFLDDDLGLALPGGTIGYLLEDVTGEDAWEAAVCVFNGTGASVEVPLPGGRWWCAMNGGRLDRAVGRGPREVVGGRVEVGGWHGVVLYRER
jgi:pullulanase